MQTREILVLGGTSFVGRAAVTAALAAGHRVTTLNRGSTGPDVPGVDVRRADRRDPDAVRRALGDDRWDAVIDTWSAEPLPVATTVDLLTDRVGHYGYVSSRSVYRWPIRAGGDESEPVVEGDPRSEDASDYAAAKRGGELAVLERFEGRCLLARAGLILGPHENVGRLPWWLAQAAERHAAAMAGGDARLVAPGPPDRPLQLVDARDLAEWMVRSAASGLTGTFDTVSPPGHTTIGELLGWCVEVTGGRAELVWVTPEQVAAAGLTGWTDLPIWVPPTGELAALHDSDTSAAAAAGLTVRSARDTVADTWTWLRDLDGEPWQIPDRGVTGLTPEQRAALLA